MRKNLNQEWFNSCLTIINKCLLFVLNFDIFKYTKIKGVLIMPKNLKEMNEEVKSNTNVEFNNMYSTSFDSMKKTNDSEDVTETIDENEEKFEMQI